MLLQNLRRWKIFSSAVLNLFVFSILKQSESKIRIKYSRHIKQQSYILNQRNNRGKLSSFICQDANTRMRLKNAEKT